MRLRFNHCIDYLLSMQSWLHLITITTALEQAYLYWTCHWISHIGTLANWRHTTVTVWCMLLRDLASRKYSKLSCPNVWHFLLYVLQPKLQYWSWSCYCVKIVKPMQIEASWSNTFDRYDGLLARSYLAALDHNHHLHRTQAHNAKGELVWSRHWSKRAKRWKPVIVKEKKTYSYIPVMSAHVLKAASKEDLKKVKPTTHEQDPTKVAPTIASLPAPSTADLVKEHATRF